MSSNNKLSGILWLTLPTVSIIIIMLAYSLVSYLTVPSISASETQFLSNIGIIIQWLLGFVGIIAFIVFIVGIPLGISLIMKDDSSINKSYLKKDKKYSKLTIEQIKYINGFSLVAFLGGFITKFIWPLGNGLLVWAILSFIPFVDIYVAFKLGFSGRRLSWENGKWNNFKQFKLRQTV